MRWLALALVITGCGNKEVDAADTVTVGPRSEASITLADGEPCRDNAPKPGTFVESSAQFDIDFEHDSKAEPWPENPTGIIDFSGAAIADIDGDGFLDLYLTSAVGPDGIFVTGGRGPAQFEAKPRGPVLETENPESSNGVIVIDVDGDGDRDALLTTMEDPYVVLNDGTGAYTSADLLNFSPDLRDERFFASFAIAAGDLNGDRILDLIVSNHLVFEGDGAAGWPARQWLMIGRGDGTYEDASDALPAHAIYDWTFLTSLTDFDNDGDLDVYVVNDTWSLDERDLSDDTTRIGSRLYRNDGVKDGRPILVDVSEQSGADVEISAMGVAVGDYDNDGLLDAFVTSATPLPPVMLRGLGDLKFEDTTFESGAAVLDGSRTVGWGAIFVDADADGWEDLFLTHGPAPDKPDLGGGIKQQPNVLMRNLGGEFEEVEAGVEGRANSRSPVVGDLNRDGFVDMVVANVGAAPYLYLNGCDDRPWLTVKLEDVPPNRDAIGARIWADTGDLRQQRRIHAGSDGLYGSSAPEAYFGFEDGTSSVTVTVRWPDGSVSTLDDVPTRKIATIQRTQTITRE